MQRHRCNHGILSQYRPRRTRQPFSRRAHNIVAIPVFQRQNQLPPPILIQKRRAPLRPGPRCAQTFVTFITTLDHTVHRDTASVTDIARNKRRIAPAWPAKPVITRHARPARQAFRRKHRMQQGLKPGAMRNKTTQMQTPPLLTDRSALIAHRARASDPFLSDIAREEILDRLSLVNRTFTSPLIVGPAPSLVSNAKHIEDSDTLDVVEKNHDLALHFMALHWANDPVGQIIQSARALKPDGLFQAVCLGGQTLNELRTSLAQAESDITGGLSPRIAPMGEIRDLGALLQRAGLALPVADSITIRTSYKDAYQLMHDLRRFGETNALNARLRRPTRRAVFERCAEIYAETFAENGKIIATFEFLFLSGWAPSADQPKPLRPGSATARLSDALNTTEKPLRD